MSGPDHPHFLDEPCPLDEARFVVLPVPYEMTVTYLGGTADGPEAILRASDQMELLDERFGWETNEAGIHTAPPLRSNLPPERLADSMERLTGDWLDMGKVPVVLGGEHSITLGAVRAAASRFSDLSVLHLDAHADLRDEYEGTRFGHGCVMRRVADLGLPMVQVGIRSISTGELRWMAANRDLIRLVVPASRRPMERYVEKITEALSGEIYLSIDMDAFDPAVCPGVGTPEPGGLDWFDVNAILDALEGAGIRIVAFDIVETRPIPGEVRTEFTAARLTYRVMGHVLSLEGWRTGEPGWRNPILDVE